MDCPLEFSGGAWVCPKDKKGCGFVYKPRDPSKVDPSKPPRRNCPAAPGYAERMKTLSEQQDKLREQPTPQNIGPRAGSQLVLLILESTQKYPQRTCKRDPGKRMNKKGMPWCKEHSNEIAEMFQELHIAERWHVVDWPNYDEDPDEAVKAMITEAIERAEKFASVQTEEP